MIIKMEIMMRMMAMMIVIVMIIMMMVMMMMNISGVMSPNFFGGAQPNPHHMSRKAPNFVCHI